VKPSFNIRNSIWFAVAILTFVSSMAVTQYAGHRWANSEPGVEIIYGDSTFQITNIGLRLTILLLTTNVCTALWIIDRLRILLMAEPPARKISIIKGRQL
jgi:hypothetical protein